MKVVLVLAVIALASAIRFSFQDPELREQHALFQKFITDFNKTYDHAETPLRFENFRASLDRIRERNAQQKEQVFGITKFSDMSVAEFQSRYLNYVRKPRTASYNVLRTGVTAAASNIDWRTRHAVTAVKDQGQCGSCWAFSATEETESMWFLHNGTLFTLAPQQVVSCDTVDQACDGGDTVTAYAYIEKAGGIVPEKDFPYTSGNTGDRGHCKYSSSDVIAPVKGFSYATPPCDSGSCNHQNQANVENALSTVGPLSICVYAESWMDYTSGVLSSNCPHSADSLDHCVQLVGMQDNYWIVRNSWNTDWGIEGYIHISKTNNLCGILDEVTIPKFN